MWSCTLFYYLKIKLFSDWLRIVFLSALSPLFIRNITLIKGNTMRYILALASSNSLIRFESFLCRYSVRCRHSVRFWTKCWQEEFLCRHSVHCWHSVLYSIFTTTKNFQDVFRQRNEPYGALLCDEDWRGILYRKRNTATSTRWIWWYLDWNGSPPGSIAIGPKYW